MQKPIVFFSHSSKDQHMLARLKEMVIEKTGNSVEIFLSSDGQSIPLGRNWVYRIEEALKGAKLMLVFVSPNALRSNWIFFESGFAYAKDIQVVPVGIGGVDLGTFPPPLGLLQGFNITSADGLNNIIALFNKTFSHSHRERFNDSEFEHLISRAVGTADSTFGNYSPLINEIRVLLTQKESLNCSVDQAEERVFSVLQREGVQYQRDSLGVYSHGISFFCINSPPNECVEVRLDPSLTAITIPLVNKVLSLIRDGGVKGVSFILEFVPLVGCLTDKHKITARTYNTSAKLGKEGRLVWEQLDFLIGHTRTQYNASIDIKCNATELAPLQLMSLLQFLFDRGILFFKKQTDVL